MIFNIVSFLSFINLSLEGFPVQVFSIINFPLEPFISVLYPKSLLKDAPTFDVKFLLNLKVA